MNRNTSIGLVGLGNLGFQLANRILESNKTLYVYDLDVLKIQKCVDLGAIPIEKPKDFLLKCKFILLALPSPEVVSEFIKEELKLSDTIKKKFHIIDISTNAPDVVQELYYYCQIRGITYIDSPLTGGVLGAKNGTMTAMVGGTANDIRKVLNVLKLFTKKVVHIGSCSHGSYTKLIHNMLGEIQVYSIAEAFCFAQKIGLDLNKVFEVLSNGMISSKILTELYANGALINNFEPQASVYTAEKDQRLLLNAARTHGIDLTFSPIIYLKIQELIKRDLGNKDVTSAVVLFEEQFGVSLNKLSLERL